MKCIGTKRIPKEIIAEYIYNKYTTDPMIGNKKYSTKFYNFADEYNKGIYNLIEDLTWIWIDIEHIFTGGVEPIDGYVNPPRKEFEYICTESFDGFEVRYYDTRSITTPFGFFKQPFEKVADEMLMITKSKKSTDNIRNVYYAIRRMLRMCPERIADVFHQFNDSKTK